jgi:hypothetical protein
MIGLIRSKSSSSEGSLINDLLRGCKAKFYIQPSVELPHAYVGALTFQIKQHPETFLSYLVEQGFGKDLEVLEEHTPGRRVISTVSSDGREEYVLDQVVKRVSSNSVFVGVKSCRSEVRPEMSANDPNYKIRGEVYLEGFFVESFHLLHKPRTKSKHSNLKKILTTKKLKKGITVGEGLMKIEHMLNSDRGDEYQGWPDRDMSEAYYNRGCKITVLSSRKHAPVATNSADEPSDESTLTRRHLEGIVLDMNSFYVRLNAAKAELEKVRQGAMRSEAASSYGECRNIPRFVLLY